jgi:hypothetical protein
MNKQEVISVMEDDAGRAKARRHQTDAEWADDSMDKSIAARNEVAALYSAFNSACERIADGPQSYSEAKTSDDWAEFYLQQARGNQP